MGIDGEDFHLDLLFFHRKLRRLVAVELKIDRFKAAFKGQMDLYLNWINKYERQDGADAPYRRLRYAVPVQSRRDLSFTG